MFEMDAEISGQWTRFISLWLWLAWRYKALYWVTYGCNLVVITYTITLTLIRLSLRGGMKDAGKLPVSDHRCSVDDKYVDFEEASSVLKLRLSNH